MLPIFLAAAAVALLAGCRSQSSTPPQDSGPTPEPIPPPWNNISAPSVETVRRDLQTLMNGAYRQNPGELTLRTVDEERSRLFQQRRESVSNWAFRDSQAARAYDIPSIRRFFYIEPNVAGSGLLLASESDSTNTNTADWLRLQASALANLSQDGGTSPFSANWLNNDSLEMMRRALEEDRFRPTFLETSRELLRRSPFLEQRTWRDSVQAATSTELRETYRFLQGHYREETRDFSRIAEDDTLPRLLRSLRAAQPPFPLDDAQALGNLTQYIALQAAALRLSPLQLQIDPAEEGNPASVFFNDMFFALRTVDPLDNASLRHRARTLAATYFHESESLSPERRFSPDRLAHGERLWMALSIPGFGPPVPDAELRALRPALPPGEPLPLRQIQELPRSGQTIEIPMNRLPVEWRSAAGAIQLSPGVTLANLIDNQVYSLILTPSTAEGAPRMDRFMGTLYYPVSRNTDPWDLLVDLSAFAYFRQNQNITGDVVTRGLAERNAMIFENRIRHDLLQGRLGNSRELPREEFLGQVELATQIRFLNGLLGFPDTDQSPHDSRPSGETREVPANWMDAYAGLDPEIRQAYMLIEARRIAGSYTFAPRAPRVPRPRPRS